MVINSSRYSFLERRIGWKELATAFTYVLLLLIGLAWLRMASSVALLCTLCIIAIALVSSSEICCRLIFICFPFLALRGFVWVERPMKAWV